MNNQIQLFPYEKPIVSQKEKPEKQEKLEKPLEPLEKPQEKPQNSTSEKLPSLTFLEEKKEEDVEDGIYSNYMRYVKDSQIKNEKKGQRSLSISSTNSSQNSCLISSSQHFSFALRFPRQLWEDVVEFINTISEQQG